MVSHSFLYILLALQVAIEYLGIAKKDFQSMNKKCSVPHS